MRHHLDSLLKALKHNTFCELKPSLVHGVGVFALKDIPEGVNPFAGVNFDEDILVEHESLKGLDKGVRDLVYSLYFNDESGVRVQIRDGEPVTPNKMSFHYYVNHSNEPNVRWYENCYCYKTLRIVKENEELFLNYNEYYDEV